MMMYTSGAVQTGLGGSTYICITIGSEILMNSVYGLTPPSKRVLRMFW